ncbi:MAG: hypothetical protein CL506_01865 [Actinobacteria bacterium]|nr:hypothetical protein [Actinomycetota bacterium]|tara:strand:- start:36 stop:1304 length:1269 start_codon:yes stop_codon:yes gene_type:complete
MTISKHKIFFASHIANEKMDGWLENHAIVIEKGIIIDVVPETKLASDYKEKYKLFHLGNCYLIPGLIETHAHVQFSATTEAYDIFFSENLKQLKNRAVSNLKTALLSGVTTIRDLGTPNELIFALKKEVDQGYFDGPEIFPTGTPITTDKGHCWFFGTVAHSTKEVLKAMENQINRGATHLKIMASGGNFTPSANPRKAQYSAKTIGEAVKFCESNGTYLCAHTLSKESTKICIEQGVNNIIHGRWFDSSPEKSYSFDRKYSKLMSDKGIFLDSTLSKDLLEYEAEKRGHKKRNPNPNVAKAQPTLQEIIEIFRIINEDGVELIGALDMGMSQAFFNKSVASAWAHVEWLGFNHWKAIRSLTTTNAKAMKIDNYKGKIKKAYVADFTTYDKDPSINIRNLNFNPKDIILKGNPIKIDHKTII